jgi:glycosyltransferase involved in cell wall biosynthesis
VAVPPKVSVGLPVFNGERYLEKAIGTILAQTFTDFELIISDNASTDRTGEICRDYQSRDSRIRYYRNDVNIGGANNWNFAFRKARGGYFCWISHDDFCAPQLLEKCAEVLDRDRAVVLCHPIVTEVDQHDNTLRVVNRENGSFRRPHERFRALASFGHNCEDLCGLMRSDILRKTRLISKYTDADRTLLTEISLYGRFYRVPEPLFYKRIHPKMSTQEFPDWYERMEWFKPGSKGKITFPNWLQFFHYMWIILKAPIGFGEKIKCYRYMPHWLIKEWHGGMMARDIKIALKKFFAIGLKR